MVFVQTRGPCGYACKASKKAWTSCGGDVGLVGGTGKMGDGGAGSSWEMLEEDDMMLYHRC